MNVTPARPVVGISIGDINGIGPEIIIKTFSDSRLTEFCIPVLFGSNKVINFYKKELADYNLNFTITKDLTKLNPKQLNIYPCWEEEIDITPGQVNETGGKYAVISLREAAQALKENKIQALVTAPLHKKNVQQEGFDFTGHTPFLRSLFGVKDVLMLMVAENMRVGVLTEHIPVAEIAQHVTKENILSKLRILKESLRKDFGIDKPRVAVLGLNPHAGDEGLVGKEELEQIRPALIEARKQMDLMAFGPYSPDAFFAHGHHERFDAVLAMYHDQGLIPFKSLAKSEGVNVTVGLGAVRTSPDHGTALDIAGKGRADESSFREALFTAIDIYNKRMGYADARRNPLRRVAHQVVSKMEDERIELN
ncbi:MAG: 4-hydroxythreonine-4-phosphate dehydrogenase PdxA [Chitinophagaceae bacterium]|jgi:4-hydroxythreonine-4-phosphate dehydrogenase|nr:4-hydroxythreonine-4-phosphate dehydrogenase PdxA [Chitinophagaceae bacterium]